MASIIIGTDFSEASVAAVRYALELAERGRAHSGRQEEIILFHAYHVPVIDPLGMETSTELMNNFRTSAEQRLTALADAFRLKYPKLKIKTELRMGFAVPELLNLIETHTPRLVVLGYQGESSVLDKVFGSVALAITEDADCPILLVPSELPNISFQKIFFSNNIMTLDVYSLTLALNFCRDIEATIHFFTVLHEDYSFSTSKVKRVYEELARLLHFDSRLPEASLNAVVEQEVLHYHYGFNYALVEAKSLVPGITHYVKRHQPDLLILSKRHKRFFQRFFGKSVTDSVAKALHLPLLILPTYVQL